MTIAALDSIYRAPAPERVERLNRGIAASVFRALAAGFGVPAGGLAAALGLSDRTLRNRTRLTADETERSFRAYRVFQRAAEVLGDEERARAWLRTPQRALGEKAPLALLIRDVGAEEVLNLLGAIEDGGYL